MTLSTLQELEASRKGTEREKEGSYYIEIRDAVFRKAFTEKYKLGVFNWHFSKQLTALFTTGVIYGSADMNKVASRKLTDEYENF